MSRVILQPCGGVEPQKHFKDTIQNPVSLDRIQNFVSNEVTSDVNNGHETYHAATRPA